MAAKMTSADTQKQLGNWRTQLDQCCIHLREMAGSTEHAFLAIGGRLQDIYQQCAEMSSKANQLAEVASGVHIPALIDKLGRVIEEIETYLHETDRAASAGGTFITDVTGLLGRIDSPLESFKRMSKHLYMLEVSIKIESARLGDKGSEFINLAQDIRQLSQQIKEKSAAIADNRADLAKLMLVRTPSAMRKSGSDTPLATVQNMKQGLHDLQAANARFGELGQEVARVSEENSHYISAVVQSMQFHDIFRQQVEHVVEALEPLVGAETIDTVANGEDDPLYAAVGRIGDVCELQEAQLQFAAGELHAAVSSILENLHDINNRRRELGESLLKPLAEGGESSFIDAVSGDLQSGLALLDATAARNATTTATMQEMGGMVDNMTGFVEVIKDIGSEIIQISLNARIKASGTGSEGDALSVLAEEISQLSNEAVNQTTVITATLGDIHGLTSGMTRDVDALRANLETTLGHLESESSEALDSLRKMEQELVALSGKIDAISRPLGKSIDQLCSRVDVHTRIKAIADETLLVLKQIFEEARAVCPASDSFKEDLRRMAEQYTMESERRIHEAISNRHGIEAAMAGAVGLTEEKNDSEFGDNVDLF